MPRFYLNIRNGIGYIPDEEGREFDDTERARRAALEGARSIMSAEVSEGRLDLTGSIEVTGENGVLVFTVHFRDAVEILLDEPRPAVPRLPQA